MHDRMSSWYTQIASYAIIAAQTRQSSRAGLKCVATNINGQLNAWSRYAQLCDAFASSITVNFWMEESYEHTTTYQLFYHHCKPPHELQLPDGSRGCRDRYSDRCAKRLG